MNIGHKQWLNLYRWCDHSVSTYRQKLKLLQSNRDISESERSARVKALKQVIDEKEEAEKSGSGTASEAPTEA